VKDSRVVPGLEEIRPADALEERFTDLGNARRLVRMAGDDLRYVSAWGEWLVWADTHWQRDQTGEVERRAKHVVESLYLDAATETDPDRRKALAKHALVSQSARSIRNMIQLRPVAVPPDAFDRDPWLLACQNGTLELQTAGTLRPTRRADLITRCVPVDYDPAATCPTFEGFLRRIFDDRPALIAYVQRAIGYALTGDTREQVLFLCSGSGANGKTTLLQAVSGLLAGYAATLAADTLLARKGDATMVMNDLSTLQGARFVVAAESDMGRRLAEGLVKQLTGGEAVKVKRLFADVYAITPTFKLWIGTNHRPQVRGTDHAIWRRIHTIQFDVEIPEAEQDRGLLEKLQAERAGILRWAVEGCLDWQRGGLGTPEEVRRATAEYRAQMDNLGDFLAERCLVEAGASLAAGDLYDAYKDWAQRNGEPALSSKTLGLHLRERGFAPARTTRSRRWVGLRLRTPMDDSMTNDESMTAPAGSPPTRGSQGDFLESASSSVIASRETPPDWMTEGGR
jgi:putative DNA primase/helicase